MLYSLLICLTVAFGQCEYAVKQYPTRAECLADFEYVKANAPRQPVRMYCVTIAKVKNA